jgi:Rrf2 family transcriptional regulator, iron-sulfur cluster assembly transcription factor
MIFSKSFGYAIRGVLYVAMMGDRPVNVSLDELAGNLNIPRHFLGKIMKRMAKGGIVDSKRGPSGGFHLNHNTLNTSLLNLFEMTGEVKEFNFCIMRLRSCSETKPCPLHTESGIIKKQWYSLMENTTINDLLKRDLSAVFQNIPISE